MSRYCIKHGSRSWLMQQLVKRDCRCPAWWQVETWNVLLMMFLEIIDKEE